MASSLTALLTKGQIEVVLLALLEAAKRDSSSRSDDIVLMLSRFRRAQQHAELGLIEQCNFETTCVQLTRAALKLVRELVPDDAEAHEVPKPLRSGGEVFISYKWGGESEQLAERIEEVLLGMGLKVVRDKHALGFKGDIEQFMAQLSRGHAVVCILSDGYLRSQFCMHELLMLMRRPEADANVFPIVLPDAKVYVPTERLRYVQHWQLEHAALNAQIRELPNQEGLETARAEIDLYAAIASEIDVITGWLKRTNALDLETHLKTEFALLRSALASRMKCLGYV